jgi:hypothetical protein
MATESKLLSQTLQSITTTKMREQDRRSKTFEVSKSKVLETVAAAPDERARLEILLAAFKDLSTSNKGISYVDQDRKDTAQNTARYLEQSYRDPSVSSTIIQSFERNLEKKLDQESQRFEFANLYYRLLSEWVRNSFFDERAGQPLTTNCRPALAASLWSNLNAKKKSLTDPSSMYRSTTCKS